MISIRNVTKRFGGIIAVDDSSFDVMSSTICSLIGPNGAGKTTLFNVICGSIEPSSGSIFFNNKDITGQPSHQLFYEGILRTFQIAHEFSKLTVLENLMVVPGFQSGEKLMNAWINRKKIKDEEKKIKDKATEVIEFLNLSHLTYELAGNLSGGQKKLLELGRTMMVDANIVLLDEVGAGVNRTLLNEIAEVILKLNKEKGYTFCMIEHDIEFISKLCSKVIVMSEGKILTEGKIEDIKKNEEVISAYLGRSGAV